MGIDVRGCDFHQDACCVSEQPPRPHQDYTGYPDAEKRINPLPSCRGHDESPHDDRDGRDRIGHHMCDSAPDADVLSVPVQEDDAGQIDGKSNRCH